MRVPAWNRPQVYTTTECVGLSKTCRQLIEHTKHFWYTLRLKLHFSHLYNGTFVFHRPTVQLGLTIVYLVYYLLRPHMIINCVNVVINLFCLGVKIIFCKISLFNKCLFSIV